MDSREHERGDFIPYPTHRVVGTIADPKDARAAIEGLLRAGFRHPTLTSFMERKTSIAWTRQAQSMVSSHSSSEH
jgi:hypothetical protein